MSRPSWIGKILGGRYRIDELIGQGGMSAVFKAYDPNLKRVVAAKLIHAHLADDPHFIARFEEEAAAVAQLRHANIVQVYDFNHDGDVYYMIQEFIPGESLQERLRRLNESGRRLQIKDAIRYTMQIAEAAAYAHRRGMIHRDIKPANIMLDVNDQAILMDFGIVKILGGTQHTATGAVVGTALYLAPEMIRNESADPRSDLYSLGVTLFEMVNGRPPFEATSAMTLMMMHLNDPVPDLRGLRPEVPEMLISVIERSLAKNREQRYSSMAEFNAALMQVLTRLETGKAAQTTTVDGQTVVEQPASPAGPPIASTPVPNIFASTQIDEAVHATPTQMESPLSSSSAEAGAVAYPSTSLDNPAGTPGGAAPRTVLEASGSGAALYGATGSQAAAGSLSGSSGSTAGPAGLGTGGPGTPTGGGAGGQSGPPFGGPPSGGSPSSSAMQQPSRKSHPLLWVAAAVALLLVCIAAFSVAGVVYSRFRPRANNPTPLPSQTLPVALAFTETPQPSLEATGTPSATPTSTDLSTPTLTPAPSETPTPTVSPTPTIPVGVPYVVIQGITTGTQQNYVVNYTTFEYTEQLPGMHVHFFFNTTPPDQAGVPGKGRWYLYGGPRPFDKFTLQDRPEHATQMCALVANSDHSVQFNSGNCFILPNIVVAAPFQDMYCLFGPGPEYPPVVSLPAGQITLVRGISPDEAWWNVENPQNPTETCWLPKDSTSVAGDLSTLALVQPPPAPTGAAAAGLSIQITKITLDDQGRYVVEFATQGYTPALPGTHIHFFFNTTPPDQVGISGSGSRLMHGEPAPFTGYRKADRPAEATQLCALVANNDHTVISGSGNCIQLPDVP